MPPWEIGRRGGQAAEPGLPGAADSYALPTGQSALHSSGHSLFPDLRTLASCQRPPAGACVCAGRPDREAVSHGKTRKVLLHAELQRGAGTRGPGAAHGPSAVSTRPRASLLRQVLPAPCSEQSSPHGE